ncbi:MAG: rhodanese-like domain-containing protein [Puniceicoccales bacterium]
MNETLPIEISVSEAYGRRKAEEDLLFLDVREPFEVQTAHLSPDLHLPMQTIVGRYGDIPTDRPIIVYCHHGMRSLRVTEYLRSRGIDQAQSMAGGIDAWSLEIDPTVPRY